ncbi:tRNA (adenosine(37)-N6)-threonylcarbamoyltransferase complex ATPase subunit type 1 TsaE [Planctomonas psychrotolerans]|uniref:tRNA (adenosine(37)-N6)-threonylcarbamoyltransferase complex ATPase subunit type 1 TsaE n=1 Tax=Planctomonas psychrotolerans TaxID=2528712 RepID=UPI001238E46F|nr:tRNA (adenosine(37)-N6)-threonylcarbamoyltransferase complex ATPase subunit type 1 TsaE [Planctomonas psychrotolerans]
MTALGVRLGALLRAGDLVVLTGRLGAGKTTLTRGIGAGLGVRGPVTSPTFVLARTHPSTVGGPPLVHVDAYRLSTAAELDDLDIDFARSVVVVEWGLGLLDGITDSWLELVLDRPTGAEHDATPGRPPGDDEADAVLDADVDVEEPIEPRTVSVTAVGDRWADLADGLGAPTT